jgi:hypothetical protein
MKNEQMNSEAAIDRVLTALGGVEAPPEIEQRVLQAVQRRASEQKPPRFAALTTLTHWQPWAIAACVVVLSIAASVAVRKRHEPRHEDAILRPYTSPHTEPSAQVADAQSKATPHQAVVSGSRHKESVAPTEALDEMEALAISEMNAPSKPAPPLPLTHQEKLLAEAVHQDNPTDLSSLSPEVRDRQMELSKAEFHDFFEPPSAKDNE